MLDLVYPAKVLFESVNNTVPTYGKLFDTFPPDIMDAQKRYRGLHMFHIDILIVAQFLHHENGAIFLPVKPSVLVRHSTKVLYNLPGLRLHLYL